MKVSINIPCFNRKDMLRDCINSFINQTYKDFEIIVVDDGSDDDLTLISSMDNRIKYVRQEHLGIAKAFNNAIDNSIGEYILPFGSDDLASNKDLLKVLVETAEQNKEYDVFYTDYIKNGKVVRFPDAHQKYNKQECYEKMLNRQFVPHGATLWKKDKVIRYDESLESAVDWQIFLDAFESDLKFYHIPEALWTYVVGHSREEKTKRQTDCCNKLLNRRGYYFDNKNRCSKKICN